MKVNYGAAARMDFYTIVPWKFNAAATLSLLRGSGDGTALYLLHSLCPE
jgi:hypothetical protein